MGTFAAAGSIFICLILYFIYKVYSNTKRVQFNHVSLPQEKEDPHSPSLTVLHISDMHMENISISPQKLFEMLSDEPADLIALTGDYLDKKKSIPKLTGYLEVFRKLNPKYGIYAVFGNHDYVLKNRSFSKLRDALEHFGCKVLRNENLTLKVNGRQINIIGIDDFSTNRSDLVRSFQGVQEGFRVVLTHDPNVVLEMKNYDFDYLLAGHFHGGQINWPKPYHLFKMGKLVRMDIIQGLHYYQGKPFYISTGLGQTGLNIRIGSRPEITLHHIPLHAIGMLGMQKDQIPKVV